MQVDLAIGWDYLLERGSNVYRQEVELIWLTFKGRGHVEVGSWLPFQATICVNQ